MKAEDYVSFETAKLLKENGFNWLESPFYSEQDKDEWRRNNSYTVSNKAYNPELPFDSEKLTQVAPHVSLQMAMKWLREVHNLHIEVYRTACGYLYIISRIPTGSELYSDGDAYDGDDKDSGQWTTYEKACEAAIRYCLE